MAVNLRVGPIDARLQAGALTFYYGAGYGALTLDADPDAWGFLVRCRGQIVARRAYTAGMDLQGFDRADCARGLLAGIGWWLAGGAA